MAEPTNCHPDDCRDTVSIHTRKITDSCRDKDCIEDLRVFLTRESQAILDSAGTAKARTAELIYAYIDVEPVAFNRNHYCIDITFFYRILADANIGTARPATLCGLATFSKRAVLCGEDSAAKVFTSDTKLGDADGMSRRAFNHPTAVVEVLDPMILAFKVRELCDCPTGEPAMNQLPEGIRAMFDDELVLSGERRRLYVTLGQFSLVRLERDVQIVVNTLPGAFPTKECCDNPGCVEDPCEMFSRIAFPVKQFFPKGCESEPCGYRTTSDEAAAQ